MPLGDWIILGFFIIIIAGWIYIPIGERLEEKRAAEAYKEALAFEIADGVTLLEGIRAFFGEDGCWLPDSRSVGVIAGETPGHLAYREYDSKKNQVRALIYYPMSEEGQRWDGRDELIGLMVQAARKQRSEAPW